LLGGDGAPIVGAQLTLQGLAGGHASWPPTTTVSDANGVFSTRTLPGATAFDVRALAPPAGELVLPEATFAGIVAQSDVLPDLRLRLPAAPVGFNVTLLAPGGGPLSEATVLISGTVSGGSELGPFSQTGVADANGCAALRLYPGSYRLTVVPAPGGNIAAVAQRFCVLTGADVPTGCALPVGEGGNLTLQAPSPLSVSGVVQSNVGQAVRGARVQLTLLEEPAHRVFADVTDATGAYALAVDPPSADPTVTYAVEVEPPPDSGMPRYLDYTQISSTAPVHHDMRLFTPSFVHGRIYDADHVPQPNVGLAFYVQRTSSGEPLLVGVGQSSAAGEFAVPLPTAGGAP
jgi:hypothetical protein